MDVSVKYCMIEKIFPWSVVCHFCQIVFLRLKLFLYSVNSTYLSYYRLYYTNSIQVSYCSLYIIQAWWPVHYELGTKLQAVVISSLVQNLSGLNATLVSTEKPNRSMTSVLSFTCLRFNSIRIQSPPRAQWNEGCQQSINEMLLFILSTFQTGQWASVGIIELFSPHKV
jgi:hypothetical protein